MSVNSKMTAIANAVRDLLGISGTMGLDAMATNISGAKTAVDAALASLTEKGVTVPDGTKVDGLAALIAAIEAGGGSGGADLGPFTQIVTGTITPSSDTQYFEIPNVVTEFIVAFAIGYVGTDRIAKISGYLLSGGYTVFTVYNIDANSIDLMSPIKIMRVASTSNSKSNNYPDISGNTFDLGSSYKLKAGHEYGYVICTRKNPSEHATMTGGST